MRLVYTQSGLSKQHQIKIVLAYPIRLLYDYPYLACKKGVMLIPLVCRSIDRQTNLGAKHGY